ncbi:MAG: hypothetical protein ACKVYV_08560 [Limisphaerales bacterium]
MTPPPPFRASRLLRRGLFPVVAALTAWLAAPARAELQFDVFLGYDENVREGAWFPVVFEVMNDGPAFTGTIELGQEGGLRAHTRRLLVELPTGTRKRLTLPAFAPGGRFTRWEARLLDEKGKVRGERGAIQSKDRLWDTPLLGAVPRTFAGMPTLPEFKGRPPEAVPGAARLNTGTFPADPLTLEGLDAVYLSGERAADFRPEQADALLAWLQGGGHLVVGLEQPGDLAAVPWLAAVTPFAPREAGSLPAGAALDTWLRRATGVTAPEAPAAENFTPGRPRRRPSRQEAPAMKAVEPYLALTPDGDFSAAVLPAVLGEARGGETLLAAAGHPLVVQARQGRGRVSVLAFAAEREPFRTWKLRPWFWARLLEVPPQQLVAEVDGNRYGLTPVDGILGAMIDSRQVRKLPVGVLLALLLVYLAVIGPVDRLVLRRLKREVWTWVTFPAYVVVFSGLIYFIGYRLRAGESEWNELQVVDILPRGDGAIWRGRTFGSIYSPANASYRLASEQPFASVRGEFMGASASGDGGRLNVIQSGRGFVAETFVPVWVNQLVVSDWLQPGTAVLEAAVVRAGRDDLDVRVLNASGARLDDVRLVLDDKVYQLGGLAPGEEIRRPLGPQADGTPLADAVGGPIQTALFAVNQRRQAFGAQESGRIDRGLDGLLAASFAAARVGDGSAGWRGPEGLLTPPGFDLTRLARRGEAVILAWAGGAGAAAPIHQFTPRRQQRDTVYRLAVPVTEADRPR